MTVDVSTRGPLAAPLRAYATRFHATISGGHHVASPLGAWLLLALCAPASSGRLREELARVLGMNVDSAFSHASHLLDRPHPAVPAAFGAWTAAGVGGPELARWLSWLPVHTARGPIPTQAELDAWVKRESRGVLDRSSASIHPLIVALLVSVLATKVDWFDPFEIAPASELGPWSRWGDSLTRVLTSSGRDEGAQYIARTERIGDLAVHIARARGGIDVVSVIADAEVAPGDVLDAAYEIAMALANEEPIARVSLYDLPPGDTPRWTITEREIEWPEAGARLESYRTVLPAWSATSTHVLDDPALGFDGAAEAIRQLLGVPDAVVQVQQAVRARYSRTGFEAAAETSMSFVGMSSERVKSRARMRTATLRFCHPYAVVAVVRVGADYDLEERMVVRRAWGGLPVFSAWVGEAEEAEGEPGA